MTEKLAKGRFRIGRWGAAFATTAAFTLTATPAMAAPAATAPTATAAITASCGAPKIDAWYDSDQYGSYLKVHFASPSGCGKGKRVNVFWGKIWCKSTKKLVYSSNVAGKTPIQTALKTLPPKSKCKSFYAEASITYSIPATTFDDSWHWNWGNAPA
ncbi:hypothetical protein AB0E74_10450 [Streptomyces sp. NPDC030392]|uniref:hypothetical protein n=1 Tax=Streptomyces sp. NPDC030392 TaxID=3155468 RepID=UPI0034100FED